MAKTTYTYAVARIRALEVSLFTQSVIDQLISAPSHDAVMSILLEKGWGTPETEKDPDAMLSAERAKIWEIMGELRVPEGTFQVLSYPNAFHNLKTAIKEVYLDTRRDDVFYPDTVPSRDELRDILAKKEFYRLPKEMEAAAQHAYETILHTGDGQLCDVIIDRACLEAVRDAGASSDEKILRDYAESTLVFTNIKIASRCQKTGKSAEFLQRALAPCSGIDVDHLARAAVSGFDAMCEYLTSAGYGDAADALRVSPSEFEKWCDNAMIELIRPQKYEVFSLGPLVAYVLARENEIKTVDIILSGKRNHLPEESIRERVREMYG